MLQKVRNPVWRLNGLRFAKGSERNVIGTILSREKCIHFRYVLFGKKTHFQSIIECFGINGFINFWVVFGSHYFSSLFVNYFTVCKYNFFALLMTSSFVRASTCLISSVTGRFLLPISYW